MAKNDWFDYDTTASNNTDVDGVDISEGCAPSGINNALRALMANTADVFNGGALLWADAGGTADAITADFSPDVTLNDGLIVGVRAAAANATTTPTFAPDGLTAYTIVKTGGNALVAGDIAGDGHELLLRYDLSNTQWELLNPATGGLPYLSMAKGADLASAGTLVIGTDGGYFDVTGTTTITGMTVAAGRAFTLQFDGALTLTDNASITLPGGANITTAAGDEAVFYAVAADAVRCVVYTRASGVALVGAGATLTTQGDILYHGASGLERLAAGTSGQVLQTNGAGANPSWADAAGGGKVLQVLQATKTDTASIASQTLTDISGLSQAITLSNSANKVLVMWSVSYASTTDAAIPVFIPKRDSTELFKGDAAGSRVQGAIGGGAFWSGLSGFTLGGGLSGQYLDTPGGTGPYTYKLAWRRIHTSGTAYLNRNATDSDSTNYMRLTSSITLIEVDGS